MWYCCLAVISLCKRCGLLYKWGFSHHLYQVNAGERTHPCKLIRCDEGFLARGLSQQAVQCCAAVWAQPAQTQLWSRGVLGRWRALCSVPFLGVRGVCWLHWGCCLCNLLVVEVLSARHRHQTAEASELAEKLWHFSSFAGQNYSFQSGDCAMAPWGNPWVQMCCFCQLVFILWVFFPLSPNDKAAMMLWIGLDLWKSQYMAYFKAKGVGWLTAVAHSPACVFLREDQWVNVSNAATWKYLS